MKILLPFKFNIKLFLLLSLAFILSTIIGTVSHEFGHYTVAKYLGYSSTVSYGYTVWDDNNTMPFIDSTFSKYSNEIESNHDFPGKQEFDLIQKKQMKDDFWITLCGPIQTMLTGTIGFLLLLNQRKKIFETKRIKLYQWFCVFLSLFWLRQFANLVTWTIGYLVNGKFSSNGDEIRLAISLRLPKETIAISTAVIGLAVLIFVIFRIIPIDKRIIFISAGLFGGIFGYLFWLVWVGPILMP
jgi:hypothetical protein